MTPFETIITILAYIYVGIKIAEMFPLPHDRGQVVAVVFWPANLIASWLADNRRK